MSINEYQASVTADFKGPRLRLEDSDLPNDSALESVNTTYEDGVVRTRYGFGSVWNPNEPITTLFNWVKGADTVSTAGNYLVYHNVANGKTRYVPDLASPTPVDLFTVTGAYGATHAAAGTRLYTALFNTAGEGHTECRVSSGFDSVGTITTDKCFPAPVTTAPTLSEPSAGLCTAGEKRVTFYILSRSGHRGKLGGEATITCVGDKTIRLALSAAWPSDALSIWAVMTTSSNLNRKIAVPGGTAALVGGTTHAVQIDISISDDDLLNTGAEVTDYSLWMTQDGSGNGPFSPGHVFEVGSRMGYITKLNGVSEAYFSEPGQFQQITADQHVVRLPGLRKMTTAFAMPSGAVYILGPNWTYATQATGDKPVLWPEPRLVDGMIGTLSPTGVDINASRGIAFVADQGGLYPFADGQYASKPLSYNQESDWKRINWAYVHEVKVVDDKDKNRVFVSAPIDGATAANALFMFDYSDGLTYDKVRYSYWTIDNFFHAGVASVLNQTTKRRELWISSATGGKVLREKNSVDDASPYNDDGNSISWIYETAPFPPAPMGINAHHMVRMRIRGSGNTSLTVYRMDHASSAGPFTLALSTAPNNDVKKQFFLGNTPAVTYRFTGNTADAYAELSKLESYYAKFAGL